jgi:hypothetical protein
VSTFGQLIFGLALTFVVGLCVNPLLKYVRKRMSPIDPPNEAMKEKWVALTEGNEGGWVLGNLERLLFFSAFWMDASAVTAAWLAFKVASKWNAWSNVISVPKSALPNVDEFDFLIARRRWGSQLLATFLVGTISNIIIGLLGVVVGRHGYELIRSLLCWAS